MSDPFKGKLALLIQCGLLAFAAVLAWMVQTGPLVLGAFLILALAICVRYRPNLEKASSAAAILGSAMIVARVLFARHPVFQFNAYFASIAWLIAVSLLPARQAEVGGTLMARKYLAALWFAAGLFVFVADGYLHDSAIIFYMGLALALGFIVYIKRSFQLVTPVQLALNTMMLLFIGLFVAGLFNRTSADLGGHPDELKRYYSYDVAKKDPAAFRRWAEYNRREWRHFENTVCILEPGKFPSIRLRPNAHARMFECDYQINSLGLRNREISVEKGNAYRILALGESTTFGISLTQDHRPWPELLEGLIRSRLKLSRPVEVVNAGVPGITLPENVYRLKETLLRLQPDIIISYHGYNGFTLLDSGIPPPRGKPPPAYVPRPVKLLSDCEYAVKMHVYKKRMFRESRAPVPDLSKPMQSQYAAAYRELIDVARSNHIRLVLATYSMAANVDSDPAVIEFYRQGWPGISHQIRANLAHTRIIRELASAEPWITFVDTHPNLDGKYDNFIDLVHFDKPGERQMAETFFAALKPLLQSDLNTNLTVGRVAH